MNSAPLPSHDLPAAGTRLWCGTGSRATAGSRRTGGGDPVAEHVGLQQRGGVRQTARPFCGLGRGAARPVARIVQAIRQAGLANRKAPRIKAILRQIHRERGDLSLDFLCCLPTAEAYAYLRQFPGVGPKTAACVLLFACGQPILPVDTHVHRLSRRLGLIGPRTGAEQAHEELARQVPAPRVLDFHIQLIRHGRSVCLARNPRCRECVLVDRCPEGHRRLREVRT